MNGFWWFLLGMAVMAVICLMIWLRRRKRQRARLLSLVTYLEAAGCGGESTLARVEDEFSLLEDELYKTVSELRIAREHEQKERKLQADNLADIAHQLKTPLTSMSLMTQLLEEGASPEQQEYTKRLGNQLDRLTWLTGSLLTMSRLDAGAVKFEAVLLGFEELAARAAEPVEQLLADKGQLLTVLGKEITFFCDPYWTAEAMVNLLKNCSEHTPKGGQIVLHATATPLYLQILVEDNGDGFDKSEIPHLFRRFYRGKSACKESIGIGLSLSRAIIEGQGGLLRAENRTEGGARFVLRFFP